MACLGARRDGLIMRGLHASWAAAAALGKDDAGTTDATAIVWTRRGARGVFHVRNPDLPQVVPASPGHHRRTV